MYSNSGRLRYLISMGYSDFRWEEIIMAWGLNRAQREIVRGGDINLFKVASIIAMVGSRALA